MARNDVLSHSDLITKLKTISKYGKVGLRKEVSK